MFFHCTSGPRRVLALPVLLALATPALADTTLDIDTAVRLALQDDPAVGASRARAGALSDSAVAEGQLPDPKLRTGLYNLPLDDFSVTREPVTQLRLGLVQAFPRGKTLKYKQQQGEWQARAEQARSEATERTLVRDVRTAWLELYYQLQAERVIDRTRALFAQLVDITEAHYATGRVSQQDVLRAALELSRLDDRSTRIRNAAERQRAALAKWIGADADRPVTAGFPAMPDVPAQATIAAALPEHPVIRAETAKLEASNRKIRIAREQYKPGWSAGLEYRKRFGDNPDGSDRTDMMAAMLTVDLPLFPKNRQDRRLSAGIRQAESAELMRADRLRELQRMLAADYADWTRLGERAARYESQLLTESSANTQASLNAYQSGVTEFTTLMRARITDLDVQLDALRVRVDRAKSQAGLLYLAGEDQ